MNPRPQSWDATGLVEKAWKYLDPPTQKKLADELGIERTNLSKLNKGRMPMTLDYANRIVAVVKKKRRTFSVADLGAPLKVLSEHDPTALDRLKELEAEADQLRALLRATFQTLKLEAVPGAAGGDPTVRRIPPQRGQRDLGVQP